MEGLIRELKAAAGNGVVAIGWTPAVSSLGRSPLVLSPLQWKGRLSQGSLKYCTVITWMKPFVLLLYNQRTMTEDNSHPSNTSNLCCGSLFGLTRCSIQFLIVTCAVQMLWSTFYSRCSCDRFITFSLICISEYGNYQLLREGTECNMKISCHVGVNPSSALTLQLPSACACVCVC